ncbi:MAG: ABC transporter ATP-binding protein [Propionibacteriaceae bacterium]|nr:ABC transporter ATP-binding protein [Propionibacteriaceae bacterium]
METLIRTTQLTKRYGEHTVVDHVDLEVQEGRVYGFLGPNGAGKSTTFKLLLGLTHPTAGSIEILGHDLSRAKAAVLPHIGSLIEGPAFVPRLTGYENIALVADYLNAPTANIGWALETVGLTDAARRRAGQYSLGMKQRLGIAIALVGAPRLLFLDEPTNGLDPAGVVEIRNLIVRLAREHALTVLVSSHILSEIEHMADDVGIIQDGTLRYQGPLAHLGDEGHMVFRVSDPRTAAATLAQLGVHTRLEDDELFASALPDQVVSRSVVELARAGHHITRVEHRRRSLEQIFLALTDPANPAPTHGPAEVSREAVMVR